MHVIALEVTVTSAPRRRGSCLSESTPSTRRLRRPARARRSMVIVPGPQPTSSTRWPRSTRGTSGLRSGANGKLSRCPWCRCPRPCSLLLARSNHCYPLLPTAARPGRRGPESGDQQSQDQKLVVTGRGGGGMLDRPPTTAGAGCPARARKSTMDSSNSSPLTTGSQRYSRTSATVNRHGRPESCAPAHVVHRVQPAILVHCAAGRGRRGRRLQCVVPGHVIARCQPERAEYSSPRPTARTPFASPTIAARVAGGRARARHHECRRRRRRRRR